MKDKADMELAARIRKANASGRPLTEYEKGYKATRKIAQQEAQAHFKAQANPVKPTIQKGLLEDV